MHKILAEFLARFATGVSYAQVAFAVWRVFCLWRRMRLRKRGSQTENQGI